MENEYSLKRDANSTLVKTNDLASPLKREALRDLVNLNTSGDPSQNNKALDKTQNLSNSQTSSSSKNNNKILDESSDSSLEYDSADEGSSPRDDSASDALSDKLKTPKTERKYIYTPSLESAKTPQNSPFKDVLYNSPNENLSEELQNRLISHKKKVYNELTESFETPNSSSLSPANNSIAIPANDTYEIGEDPLSFTDEPSFKLSYEPDFQHNDVDELSKSCDTLNADDNETKSYCSNDRESSVEVLKEGPRADLDNTYPVGSNDLGENVNLDTTSINNSFISAFTKLSVSPRCVEDVLKQKVNNKEFDEEKLNVSNNSRRGSGASILVISSGNEALGEILENINSIVKSKIENSTECSLVSDQKLTNIIINPATPKTDVEIKADGCENVDEVVLQDDIKLIPNSENSSSPLISKDNSNVESVKEEVQTIEKINVIENICQSNEVVESVQQLDVNLDKELNGCTDLKKHIEFNENEINPEEDVICETTNLQIINHKNEPSADLSFGEPMDCDDSYIVKKISEIIEAVNPNLPLSNSFQENEPMITETSDFSKSYSLDAPIESASDKSIQEVVQSSDLNSSKSNKTKEEIFVPDINKEEVLELNVNKENVSELSNILKENTSTEHTNGNKLEDFNISNESALIEDTEKELNISITNHSDESLPTEVIKEEILEKENVSFIEANINNENVQNLQLSNNTFSESINEKLSKSLSSDSLEAFNLEEKNCEISNVSNSSHNNITVCVSENIEKSNSPALSLKEETVGIENVNKDQEEIEKPKITNIDDIPIKCKPINYNEIDFDLENPFATSTKVRNSVERENTNNSISEKSKNLNVENKSLGKKSNTISMDTSYIVEKSNLINTKKPEINEMSNTIVLEKVKEKSTSINMDNPFATITKVRNSTDKSMNLKSDIDEENRNNPITQIESLNGNAEAKTAKITPNIISKDINVNDTIEFDSNQDSEELAFDNHKEEAFKSPISHIQNKRVDQISKTAPKGNLSPMSRCGDLMGMSPVANTDSKNATKCARTSDVGNDFLTGKDLLPDYNNIDDVMDVDDDDDDFKSPMFQDPVDFDFLQNCGNNGLAGRDFGKESLFVKFDPLVNKLPIGVRRNRDSGAHLKTSENQNNPHKVDDDASTASGLAESCSSDSSVSAINSEQGKTLGTMSSVEQSLGVLSLQTQSSQPLIASVPAIPQAVNPNVSSLQTGDKPTQIVSPAKSLRPQYQPCTPPSSQSLSKNNLPVSPAIAAIDRLINLGLNTPPPPPPVIQPKQEPEMNPQLLNELQSVRELLGNQESDLQQANDQISSLKQQLAESSEREQTLIDRVNEKSKDNRQMSIVMEEYERTMSQIIGERDAEKRQWFDERTALVRDRDETSSHLASIEHSFNDIHAKYERCKTVIQTYKTNEDVLKQTVARYEENLKKQVERYEQLRQHAMSQLDKASQEIDAVKKSSQAEIIKLQAMLKKSDIQISSLQESLAQKTKNCEELTQICDELINKVG